MRLDTRLVHAGSAEAVDGAVVAPLFDSVTYASGGETEWKEIRYSRLSNTPTQVAVREKLASIENAEDALVTSSGLAAITTALLALVPPGGHLLAQAELYGGSYLFLRDHFVRLGREVSFFPTATPASALAQWARPNTKAVYVETVSNPLLKVADVVGIAAACKAQGWLSLVDNTFLSPINFRPLDLGFDVVLHSATKYLNGHSDLVAGVAAGSKAQVEKITELGNYLGGCLDPRGCHLLNRSLKTLSVRVRAQNQTAQRIASYLKEHPRVNAVFYPGLEAKEATRHFSGFGGMLSFDVSGEAKRLEKLLGEMRYARKAPSLGGTETLITMPARTSHMSLSADERQQLGITDTLVRLSVGLEDFDDLIEDLAILLDKLS